MRTKDTKHLLWRWLLLARDLSLDEATARSIFGALRRRYEEDGRFFHNLEHVERVLDTVERLWVHSDELATVQLAAWFHDVIYDPGAVDNEARSARYLRQTMPLSIPRADVEEAARLILLTAEHQAAPGDGNARVLLDADLAILGAEPAAYERYARAIRREFAHIPQEAYRRGRAAMLRRFLQRDTIYYTPPMHEEREERARRNMRWEIATLGGS